MPAGTVITGTYEHTQGSSSNVWTVSHNLGLSHPVVDIILTGGQVMIPYDVVVTDVDTVTITLDDPGSSPPGRTGRALVA